MIYIYYYTLNHDFLQEVAKDRQNEEKTAAQRSFLKLSGKGLCNHIGGIRERIVNDLLHLTVIHKCGNGGV